MAQHVLVPIDGSSRSEEALEYVLTEMQNPKITLIHVINPAKVYTYGDEDFFDVEGFIQEGELRQERAEQMLEEYQERALEKGVESEAVVSIGNPARLILETAEDRDIDHIVMGSRGRSGVGRVLFGSVAEAVTRRASVPVTIVR